MKEPEDNLWQNLIALSVPAYPAGEAVPPYGFTTRVLAQLRSQERERRQVERISWRAVVASLVILVVTVAVTLEVRHASSEIEPGVRSLLQGADVPLS